MKSVSDSHIAARKWLPAAIAGLQPASNNGKHESSEYHLKDGRLCGDHRWGRPPTLGVLIPKFNSAGRLSLKCSQVCCRITEKGRASQLGCDDS